MKTRLQMWGNSMALRVPTSFAQALGELDVIRDALRSAYRTM